MVQFTPDSLEEDFEGICNYTSNQDFNLIHRVDDQIIYVYSRVQYHYEDTSIQQKDTTMFYDKLGLTVRNLGDGQLVRKKKKRPSGSSVRLSDDRDEQKKENPTLRRKWGGNSGRNCPRAALVFSSFLLLCCFIYGASGRELILTEQVLPEACLEWFTVNHQDCPVKVESGKEWEHLNSTCCSAFPGTVLHCQRGYFTPAEMGQYNFPACLADEKVPAGHAIKLEMNKTGMPRLIQAPCSSSKFVNKARKSSDVTFPYCTETRSSCSGEGQEKFCLGSPTSDDRCTCSAGYRPPAGYCLPSFTNNDPCVCVVMNCPPGQCAARTPAQLKPGTTCFDLKRNRSAVQFTCTPCPTSPASLAPPVSSSTDIKGTGSVDTAPPTAIEKLENNTTPVGTPVKPVVEMGAGYRFLFFLFIGVQVMLLVVVVAVAVLSHYPAH